MPDARLPLLATALLLCTAPVAACHADAPGAPAESLRPSTPQERAYLAIAWDTGAADLCAKISSLAWDDWLLNPPGLQIALTRSRCYMGVAQNTGDPALCAHVVSISTARHDGSHYTPDVCRGAAAAGSATNRLFVPKRDLLRIMTGAGYAAGDLREECAAYLDDRRATLRGSDGAALRDAAHASPYPADVVRDFLFGPFAAEQASRPHWYCELFFDLEHVVQPLAFELSPKEAKVVARAYEKHIYDIYRTLARTAEFQRRIVALELR